MLCARYSSRHRPRAGMWATSSICIDNGAIAFHPSWLRLHKEITGHILHWHTPRQTSMSCASLIIGECLGILTLQPSRKTTLASPCSYSLSPISGIGISSHRVPDYTHRFVVQHISPEMINLLGPPPASLLSQGKSSNRFFSGEGRHLSFF